MAIDKAELATELDKNPEIIAVAQEALTKKGYVIRDKATNDTFLDNYKKDVIEKELPAKLSEAYNRFDKDIEEVTGIKKESTEKSHEYLKRSLPAKLADQNKKIEALEKTIGEKGDPTGVLKKQLADAEEKFRKIIAEKEVEVTNLKGTSEKAMKSAAYETAFGEISKTFIKTKPPMFDRTAKGIKDEVLATAVLQDGILYAGDGQGGIKKDGSFNPIKIEDVLKTEFKDVIETKRTQSGSGSGNGGKGTPDDPTGTDPATITKDNFVLPAGVKTLMGLTDAMIEMGIPRNTPQFNEIFNKFGKGYEMITGADGKKTRKEVGKELPLR